MPPNPSFSGGSITSKKVAHSTIKIDSSVKHLGGPRLLSHGAHNASLFKFGCTVYLLVYEYRYKRIFVLCLYIFWYSYIVVGYTFVLSNNKSVLKLTLKTTVYSILVH